MVGSVQWKCYESEPCGKDGAFRPRGRHAICHGCTDIIHVKYLFFGVNFCSELTFFFFTKKSVFVAFNGILVTLLFAHMFTLGIPILAKPITYLLTVI